MKNKFAKQTFKQYIKYQILVTIFVLAFRFLLPSYDFLLFFGNSVQVKYLKD